MATRLMNEREGFLSTLPAGRGHRSLALAVTVASIAIFLAAAPFAKLPLPQVPAFLPIYQSALVINDAITAVLLLGQFRILRSRALLVLSSGYLFSSCMAVSHALSFPGLFAPTGLLGAGPQTTAWIYFLWHGAFPLFVIAYAFLKNEVRQSDLTAGRPRVPILLGIAAAFMTACALTLVTTVGHDALPAIMQGDTDARSKVFVASGTWILSLLALAVLWWRRPHSVLDLWAMVVMCVWIFDIALASVLNHGRYDLGWYAGRVYGLLAASFVLAVLLLENSALYARLVEAHERERRARVRAQHTSDELIAVNQELKSFSYSVSHDLRTPLRAIDGYSLMLEEDYAERLDEEGRRLLAVVRDESQRMGQLIDDLLAFSRLGRQEMKSMEFDMGALVDEVITSLQQSSEPRPIDIKRQSLPATRGDRVLMRQVWVNLISNAIKYSGTRERPLIEIGGHDENESRVFYVKDNGVGFDMKYYDKLFGVFQRLHGAEEFPGTGVGLAIVQRIVARHGGRAWAQSTLNEGATFMFSMPLASSDGPN